MKAPEYQVHQDPNPERMADKLNQGHIDGYEVVTAVGLMIIMRKRDISPKVVANLTSSGSKHLPINEGGDYAGV